MALIKLLKSIYTGSEVTSLGELESADAIEDLVRFSAGINFNASGGDTLNDYEVGTWTPLYEPTTGSFTEITMNIQFADYIKIGNLVICFWYTITSSLNKTGGSGSIRIAGLPYIIKGGAFRGTGYVSEVFSWATGNVPRSMVGNPATTKIIALRNSSGTSLDVTDMSQAAHTNATIGIFIYLT